MFFSFVCFIFTDMTISQIEAENTQMTNDLYRLLKKYSGLRNLIRELKVIFQIIFIHETTVNHFFLYDVTSHEKTSFNKYLRR